MLLLIQFGCLRVYRCVLQYLHMKLEKQICILELANRIKKLGVNQDSLVGWYKNTVLPNHELLEVKSADNGIGIAAFTVAELGELLRNQDWFEVWADFLSHEVRVWFTSPDSDPDYPAPPEDRTFVAETTLSELFQSRQHLFYPFLFEI